MSLEVGIITIHNHHNYGAVLQAFALNRTVRRLGHKCKTIDCNIAPEKGRVFKWTRYPGAMIPNLYIACNRSANRRHYNRFIDFGNQYIPLTDTSYESLEQLNSSPPHFDVFITGSDQVWLPSLFDRGIGDAFHLCFASPGRSRLIAYAPSFGVSEIPERYSERITNYLKRYHALSAREKRGAEIICKLTGRVAEQVLDPTLLLQEKEYEQIIRPPSISGQYLLVYPMELGDNLGFFKLVKEVKRLYSLPVVCVLPLVFSYQWLLIADKIVLDAGPGEFLGLFRNASHICTNSFHGTVFSILFRKNFMGFPHSCSNTRVHSLLEKTGLLNRQISDLEPRNVRRALETPIDYDAVRLRLQSSLDQSILYLKNSIES